MSPHGHLSWQGVLAVSAVLLIQGTWLFMDARTYSRWPWLWGLWGLIQAPLPLLVYLLFVRKVWRKWKLRSRT